jgi:hypothetical protein
VQQTHLTAVDIFGWERVMGTFGNWTSTPGKRAVFARLRIAAQ